MPNKRKDDVVHIQAELSAEALNLVGQNEQILIQFVDEDARIIATVPGTFMLAEAQAEQDKPTRDVRIDVLAKDLQSVSQDIQEGHDVHGQISSAFIKGSPVALGKMIYHKAKAKG